MSCYLLVVVGCSSNPSRILIRGLFLLFFIALYRAAFCCVLASICEVKLCLCVMLAKDIFEPHPRQSYGLFVYIFFRLFSSVFSA